MDDVDKLNEQLARLERWQRPKPYTPQLRPFTSEELAEIDLQNRLQSGFQIVGRVPQKNDDGIEVVILRHASGEFAQVRVRKQ